MDREFAKDVRSHLLAAVLAVMAPAVSLADADVTVSPTRIVFDGNTRKAQVSLINNSAAPKTYRISWSRKRLTESGRYEEVEQAQPGERFSDTMIRFSPRQIVLPPGKPQAVRLLLRKPADLEVGEYRSYLKFSAIPSGEERSIEKVLKRDGRSVSIQLTPIMAVSIPVIVRHGDVDVAVSISNLILNSGQGQPKLAFNIERSGNGSVYGDIEVRFVPANRSEEPLVIGQHTGVSVFPPLARLQYQIPLQLPAGRHLDAGTIEVTYRERANGGGGKILARASLSV